MERLFVYCESLDVYVYQYDVPGKAEIQSDLYLIKKLSDQELDAIIEL